jgi:hypothetical protein
LRSQESLWERVFSPLVLWKAIKLDNGRKKSYEPRIVAMVIFEYKLAKQVGSLEGTALQGMISRRRPELKY